MLNFTPHQRCEEIDILFPHHHKQSDGTQDIAGSKPRKHLYPTCVLGEFFGFNEQKSTTREAIFGSRNAFCIKCF